MNAEPLPVVIIGAGHAGTEAALAAARIGCPTVLVTLSSLAIGRMSCNPAIGGMAKSHIVAEIDAMGGEMGINADCTSIHGKTLNTRKGPAVQATRAQCDKLAYPRRLQEVLLGATRLRIVEDEAIDLDVKSGRVRGVILKASGRIPCAAVVISAGTFLHGRTFVGSQVISSGRAGDPAADPLGHAIERIGHRRARLKTGTPPRIHRDSLDYHRMIVQNPDEPSPLFSWRSRTARSLFHVEHPDASPPTGANVFHVEQAGSPLMPWPTGSAQLPCFLTHTTERTVDIIRKNLSASALYGGLITGTGVRYCPSIEDKIVKFPSKSAHHVFIEPEGRSNVRVYPNGTSNSLPVSVQVQMIQSIPGMERAALIRPGYAIEYDFFDPTALHNSLESKLVECLYMAGQVNGTTGYEEAAGQGFVAGVNAARRALGLDPVTFSRSQAYLGVLIDDLVTRGTDEPYRMFTSRAEFRLLLRQDSAPYRLLEKSRTIGIVPSQDLESLSKARTRITAEIKRLQSVRLGGVPLSQILARPDVHYRDLPDRDDSLSPDEMAQVETDTKYAGYIEIEACRADKLRRLESVRIPPQMDYESIRGLRREAVEKLVRVRPETLAQAQRIPGVNPSDLALIHVHIHRLGAS